MAFLAAVVVPVGAVAPAGASDAVSGLEGVQHFKHVVVVVLENESADSTWNAPAGAQATYLQRLKSQGVYLPNYYGTGHASLDNYVAMVSGQPGNGLTNSDCLSTNLYLCAQSTLPLGGHHLGDQLDDAHISWKSYMDGTTRACAHEAYSPAAAIPDPYQGDGNPSPNSDGIGPNYADRHNPFTTFPDFVGADARCDTHQFPFEQLTADIAANQVPAFSFITPDTCHDGHDDPCFQSTTGGLAAANQWMSQNMPSLISYLRAHDGLLIINTDEGSTAASQPSDVTCTACAGGGAGGRTGALLIAPSKIQAGTTDTTAYDHYSLLRTIEDSFSISEHLNLAGSPLATPMTDALSPPDQNHHN